MGKFIDLTGKIFNKLTVLGRCEDYISPKGNKVVKWECICECGNKTKVIGSILKSNGTKSCGCLNYEPTNTIHNKRFSTEYSSWRSMKRRCTEPTNNTYKNYGGRGIKVCDRWLESFKNFYEDMGDKPSQNHSIDRIDVNGDYEPGNCRWISLKEQQYNRRNVTNINGVSLREYCKLNNLNYNHILRERKKGKCLEDLLINS